jgi:hypothetical protein
VSCRACDLIIGAVEGGRFVHDPTCTRPLAIGSGLLRCCECGGQLAGTPVPLVMMEEPDESELDDLADVRLLRFVPPALREGEARQRL